MSTWTCGHGMHCWRDINPDWTTAMGKVPLFAALILGIGAGLGACGQGAKPPADAPVRSVYDGGLDQRAVWRGSVENCRTQQGPVDACLIQTMTDAGADPIAQQAAGMIKAAGDAGYVSAFHREGKIGVATVTYPFRANTNEGVLLVPTRGNPIRVDNPPDALKDNADYQALLKRYPDASPFAPADLARIEPLGDGVRMIYASPLRTCHACETVGVLEVPFDFDANGVSIPQPLLWVRAGQAPAPAVPSP